MQQQEPGQAAAAAAAPTHVPLRQITYQALLRSLGAEADALQKIHIRIQRQLQNLEVEEKLILQMTQRERSHISAEELQGFDMQQQQQQQPGQPQQHSATPHTAGGEQQQQQQQAGPEPEQQQAQKSQQGEPDVVTYSMAAHMQDESMDEVPVEEF